MADRKDIPRESRRARYILVSLAIIVLATVLEMFSFSHVAPTAGSRAVFFLLLNLNLMALFWLVIFVGKSLMRLIAERRQGMAGHKFKTKIVSIFLIMIAMPLSLMFLVSGELVTNYIDRFFSPQFKKPVEGSLKVAQTLYRLERMRALEMAFMAADGKEIPPKYTPAFLKAPADNDTASVKAAFEGNKETEVITKEGGDIIRAAVPLFKDGKVQGVVYVDTSLPGEVMEGINSIQKAYEDYLHLEKWKSPLKLSYLMMLAFFTLVIIFVALWIALRIAGWMTEPVKNLSLATEKIANGDYDVFVKNTSQDEMGLLIDSFNYMVEEIRNNKESIQQAYANLDNIVRNIQNGVISIDNAENISSINAAACNIFNVSAEEVLNRNYRVLLDAVDSEELEEFARSIVVDTLREVEREVWVAHSEGKKALLRIAVTSMRTTAGESTGMLVVINDITDVIKAQRAQAWQEVARRMAHEIKNPLTPIKLSTERMLRKWQSQSEDFGEVMEKSARTIIREVESLKAMVDEFSRFGKLPELKRASTDLNAMLNDVRGFYKGYKGVDVNLSLPAGEVMAEVDQEQLRRVFINLFDNSIEAMQREGTIEVSLTPNAESGRVRITVADSGPGISPEDKEKLFQPYFSTKKHGTGLGLAIADKIVAEHGGTLSVEDNEPTGARFIMDIPVNISGGTP